MSDLVVVTGISGFLGGHVALHLLKAGYAVRGSVRSLRKAKRVRETLAKAGGDVSRLEIVELDLMKDEGWREAMAGARYLQHVASPFHIEVPKDRMTLIGPAVGGTERALGAALAAGIERVVLTSSIAAIVYGHERSRQQYSGADWTRLDGPYVPPYQQSKTLAERRAWEIMDAAGRRADLSVINPGAIMGPLIDKDAGTSAALILGLLTGRIPVLPKLDCTIVDVRDVADGHVAAMTDPKAAAQRIPFSQATLPFHDMAKVVAGVYPERKLPRLQLPNALVHLLAPFSRDMKALAGEVGYRRVLETASAEALLGRPMIAAEEAIRATALSLNEQGLI